MPLDALGDLSDEALLLLFAKGDAAAARALTMRLTPRVLTHAYRLTRNHAEAEDIAQEAMLRLWRIAPVWRSGEAQVSTWLYRVVANLCIDRARRRPAISLDAVAEPADPAPSAVQKVQEQDRLRAFDTALAALPGRQRQAVVLRHIEGMSNPEIAAIMEIGVEAVESLTARGKRALGAALKGQKSALGYTDED